MNPRIVAILFALSLAGHAVAADRYVSPAGTDSGAGGSGSPWKTLRYAVTQSNPGDTVHVADGEYAAFHVEDDEGGTAAQPKLFVADNQYGARISGKSTYASKNAVINVWGSYIIFDGFDIDGSSAEKGVVCYGWESYPKGLEVRNSKIHDSPIMNVFSSFCHDMVIENNVIYGTQESHCVYFSNSGDNPVARGNLIFDCADAGIHTNGDYSINAPAGKDGMISGLLYEGNVIHGYDTNGVHSPAISMDGTDNSTLINNVIYDTGIGQGIVAFTCDGFTGPKNIVLINNTIVMSATSSHYAVKIKGGSGEGCGTNNEDDRGGHVLFNNVILHAGASPGRGSLRIEGSDFASDHNVLEKYNRRGGSEYSSLGAWQNLGYDGESFAATAGSLFVDESEDDYHLRPDSPALDAGTGSLGGKSSPPTDFEGDARLATGVDIGADEVVVTVVERRVDASSDDAEEQDDGGMDLDGPRLELVEDAGEQTVGLRFTELNVPGGAEITRAYIQFRAAESTGDATSLTFEGEKSANAMTFTNETGDLTGRTLTASLASWTPVAWTAGAAGEDQRTSDLSGIVQEIVDQSGWTAGNSAVIVISGTGRRVAESFEGDPEGAPLLHVEYRITGSGNPMPSPENLRRTDVVD